MRLPKTIKVGGAIYSVEKYHFDAEDLYGDCNHSKQRIRVDPRYPANVQNNTLLHECLHALYTNGSLEQGCGEETVVTVLANGLQMLFRDNPGLKKYL